MKQVIYETKGRAKEFNPLAINLFSGCDHHCKYCYGATVTHQTKEDFELKAHPRVTADDIKRSAEEFVKKGETRRVLLCFITDPYQKLEWETKLTRQAITALHEAGLNVIILTKGGNRSIRDFDLLTSRDAYATTLTCLDDDISRQWEPNAGLPRERIEALRTAKLCGIETWVSFEPVLDPNTTKQLLRLTHEFVGHYKVGTLNYFPNKTNWGIFGWEMKREMDRLGAKYYFKNDLLEKMGQTQATFNQTWKCR
jgi:DNA repair photolyase